MSIDSSLHSSLHSSIVYTPENTILFTIARMNPPTPGHLSVIQTLIEQGIAIGVPEVYVILSKKDDDNENPISCKEKEEVLTYKKKEELLSSEEKEEVLSSEEKEEVLSSEDRTNNMIYFIKEEMKSNTDDEEIRNKIDNIVVKTICVGPKQRTPFSPLYGIVNSKGSTGLHLLLVIGEDRNDLVKSIEDAMDKNENVASVEGILLTRKNMSKYKDKECGDLLQLIREKGLPERTSISASFVRDLVKCGMRGEFFQLYSPYLNEEKIENLYQQIQAGLKKPDPKKSKSAKSKSIGPMSDVQSTPIQSTPVQSVFEKNSELKKSERPKKPRKPRQTKRKRSKSEESESSRKEGESSKKESESIEDESEDKSNIKKKKIIKTKKKGGKKTKKRVY
jgi:nicotinic acid mononucleotide adenylyltransferase